MYCILLIFSTKGKKKTTLGSKECGHSLYVVIDTTWRFNQLSFGHCVVPENIHTPPRRALVL